MKRAVVFASAFAAMEAVSYSTHRWVMHGRGIVLHRSHHAPPEGRFERNDLFPAVFSMPATGLFVAAAAGVVPPWTRWVAAGITTYGFAYMAIHEVAIHRRLAVRIPDNGYVRWLRRRHAAHHIDGGEPYGMLLPLLSPSRRRGLADAGGSASGDLLVRRATRRATRARL